MLGFLSEQANVFVAFHGLSKQITGCILKYAIHTSFQILTYSSLIILFPYNLTYIIFAVETVELK
jgi:hypothetical protein